MKLYLDLVSLASETGFGFGKFSELNLNLVKLVSETGFGFGKFSE